MQRNSFMGLDGFVWFMGVVENRIDPLKMGRVQVRIFGWHTDDKMSIPTNDLPWAQPMFPTNASITTSAPKEGDYVVGFFTDGEGAQFPVFLGVLPGIPDKDANQSKGFSDPRSNSELENSPVKSTGSTIINTNGVMVKNQGKTPYPRTKNEPSTSSLARNDNIANTVIDFRQKNWIKAQSTGGSTWKEPYPGYNTQYPFSSTTETESGHVFQLDDTPGNERVMLSHRTGSTYEIYNSGTKLEKIVKDNYTIVHGSDFAYINGKLEITVENVAKIRIKGKTTIEIDGDVDFKVAGDMNLSVGKSLNIKTGENMTTEVAGKDSHLVGSKNETISGETQIRYEGDLHTHIGADTYSKHDGGIDYSCPSDPTRTGSVDCGSVDTATTAGLSSPNSYNNPTETIPVPEKIKPVNIIYRPVETNTEFAPAGVVPPVIPENPPIDATANTETVASTTDGCFTLPMLQAAAPKTKDSVLLNFLPSLNKICGKYDINSKLRKAHFLAQVAVESGGFRYTKEIWGPTEIQKLYEPPSRKASGLGNTQPGDGERFKGRGLIQITGRYNYTAFASSINMSLEDVTSYMETTDGAVESAAWYWIAHFKKNGNIISDEGASESVVTKVSKYVNGGTIGLSERQAAFARIYPIST